jgi:hypothetical protein
MCLPGHHPDAGINAQSKALSSALATLRLFAEEQWGNPVHTIPLSPPLPKGDSREFEIGGHPSS